MQQSIFLFSKLSKIVFGLLISIALALTACQQTSSSTGGGGESQKAEEGTDGGAGESQEVEEGTDGGDGEGATDESASENQGQLADAGTLTCQSADFDLQQFLFKTASDFEAQKLAYDRTKMQDCSGMFHQMLGKVKGACPDYGYPSPDEARDSRNLAAWYHKKGNLVMVEDAASSGNLIKPGVAMFYGQSDQAYANMTIEMLSAQDGIEHIGTVVEVKKDENGEVVEYTLFHGRNPSKPAGMSKHYKVVPYDESLPAYGNHKQQWVAVANILMPKS